MLKQAKAMLPAVALLFFGFWLVTDPGGLIDTAGAAARALWELMTQLFTAIIFAIQETV
jgi:hypothetical protein